MAIKLPARRRVRVAVSHERRTFFFSFNFFFLI